MSLPLLTNAGDQTKIQVILHVSSPTNPYRNPCSRCETPWRFRFGLPTLTTQPIWLEPIITRHYQPLPSAWIKPNTPSAVGQYRAQHWAEGHCHTSVDTPNARHNVADRHAVVTLIHGGHPDPRSVRFQRTTQIHTSKQSFLVKNS